MKIRKQYRALLDRARRYGMHRMPQPRRQRSTAQRPWGLTEAIVERYSVLEQRWPLMAFIFEQPDRPRASVSNTFHATHPAVFMNPRVLLRMLVTHRAKERRAIADRTPEQPLNRVAAPMMTAFLRPKQKPQEHDDVIARITRRAVRDENPSKTNVRLTESTVARAVQAAPKENTAAWHVHAAPMENTAAPRVPSLSRVFRRTANANDEAAPAAEDAGIERARSHAAAKRETGAVAAAQPMPDIARITDQVMQALDRRIVAQRERMGRG